MKMPHFLLYFFVLLILLSIQNTSKAQNLEQFNREQPVKLSSGFSISSSAYFVQGIEHRQQPFNWSISGSPTLYLYGFSIPFTFYYSNQNLGYHQPFNQLGASPQWRWIRAHIGYSNVHFSDYTLAGRRFLGGGIELNPKGLRFGAVYGRFQEAVEQDSIMRQTPGNFLSELPIAAFDRKGFAVKLGFGSDQSYFDFIILHAEDDPTSLKDSLSLETINPERNQAFGIKHKTRIAKQVFWESDMAVSAYTRNANDELIDKGEAPIPDALYKMLSPKNSTQALYAGYSQLSFRIKSFNSSLRYRRIARDYKTMGAYYFQTDIQEFSVNAGTQLFRRKLMLRGTLGYQHDNLGGTRHQTTERIIGSAFVGWQVMARLRLDATYANFGIQQRNPLTGGLDPQRIDQVSQSLSGQINYQLPGLLRPQTMGVSFSVQELAPRSRDIIWQPDTRSTQGSAFYSYFWPDIRLGLTGNLHALQFTTAQANTQSLGGGLGANKQFWDGKVSLQSGIRWYSNYFNNSHAGQTWSADAAAQFRIMNQWNAGAQVRLLRALKGAGDTGNEYTEAFANIQMQFNF